MSYYIFATNDLSLNQPDYSEIIKWAQTNPTSNALLKLSEPEFIEISNNGFLGDASDILDAILCSGEETWVWENDIKEKLLEKITVYMNECSDGVMYKIHKIIDFSITNNQTLYLIFE